MVLALALVLVLALALGAFPPPPVPPLYKPSPQCQRGFNSPQSPPCCTRGWGDLAPLAGLLLLLLPVVVPVVVVLLLVVGRSLYPLSLPLPPPHPLPPLPKGCSPPLEASQTLTAALTPPSPPPPPMMTHS